MKSSERDPGFSLVACFALAATIAAAALTIHPVRASPTVFWTLLAIAAGTAGIGIARHLQMRGSGHHLVASECRRIYAAIAGLLSEQESRKPKPARFGNDRERLEEEWGVQTMGRYELELLPWATKVFDQAVRAGAISEASRPLLVARSPLQLLALRNLFLEAAEELEQV
jgi:hypothetical protein